MSPGFPGVGLPDSAHATGWIWLARSSSSIGLNMPSDEGSRAGFTETDPGAPGAGSAPAPSLRPPRGLPAGKASRIHRAPGRPAITPAASAGPPLTTSQHHHDSRAAPVSTARHRENPGRPISKRDRVPGQAGHAPPARVFAPAALAGRTGKVPAAGQLASHTVPPPARSVTGWPKQMASAAPAIAGAAGTTKRSR